MIKQHKKNNWLIILLFSMTVIPFLIAWYLAKNTEWTGAGTNKGELIIPPVTTERSELIGFDSFSQQNMGELVEHWVLINIIPGAECDQVCLDDLHKTRQVRLMMSKDLTRIRRVVVLLKPVDKKVAASWWKEDTRLLRAIPTQSMVTKIKRIMKNNLADKGLLLMDPLGNIMMQYKPGFDPYDVKKDLTQLLKVSQIG